MSYSGTINSLLYSYQQGLDLGLQHFDYAQQAVGSTADAIFTAKERALALANTPRTRTQPVIQAAVQEPPPPPPPPPPPNNNLIYLALGGGTIVLLMMMGN